jgi:hypothetical protein
MFTDPQTITVNAVAKPMPRVATGDRKATYQMNDESFTLNISHSKTSDRIRSMSRVDQRTLVPDPITAVNDWETLSVYIVVDRPLAGFTSTQVEQLITGFKSWLDVTAIGKIYGQES